MITNRAFLLAAACLLPLPIAACGGDGGSETIVPEGTHYGYVVSKANVPTTDVEVREFGLDLGTETSAKTDGKIDNQLGRALSTLAFLGFDIQGTIDDAVDQGSLLLLIDFQTKDFNTSSAAGFTVKFGTNPVPPACSGSADTTCRHHLTGTGTFQISAQSPNDPAIAGKIASGTFTGGPGDVTLQLAIGSTTPIKMDLLHARVSASGISDAGIMTATVGGLLLQSALTTEVGPAIQVQVASILTRDCSPTGTPPSCGCTGTGLMVIQALDNNPQDCKVSVDELLNFSLVKQVLLPDSCSKDTCTEPDSLSVGVKIQAVKGTFPL